MDQRMDLFKCATPLGGERHEDGLVLNVSQPPERGLSVESLQCCTKTLSEVKLYKLLFTNVFSIISVYSQGLCCILLSEIRRGKSAGHGETAAPSKTQATTLIPHDFFPDFKSKLFFLLLFFLN